MNNRIIIFLSFIVLLSCKQKTKEASPTQVLFHSPEPNTEVFVDITNRVNEALVLKKDVYADTAFAAPFTPYAYKLHLQEPEYFILSDGKNNLRLFISPGDSLKVSYNTKNAFNSIRFEGRGAEPNNYIREKYLLILDHAIPLTQLYEMPLKEFRHLVDSFYVINKMYLDAFISKNPQTHEKFINTELASLSYDRATLLVDYINMGTYKNSVDIPRYLRFVDQLSVNEPQLLDVYEYKSFLQAYINCYTNIKIKDANLAPHEITLTKMQMVSAKIQNQEVKDYLLFTFLRDHVKYYGYKNSDLLFKTFEYQCQNEDMKAGLLTPYNNYLQLTKHEKAPEIKMLDINNKKVNLKQFKGRYLYVDVWATWCLPCRKEAPYFEDLKEKYSHKNIAFISISIDSKKEDWVEFLALKNLKQHQYWVPEIKPFLDAYMIKTIPHFLIIDDKGNLIDNNASRPSEGKTDWLESLPDKNPV